MSRTLAIAAALAMALSMAACAPEESDVGAVRMELPQALVQCAAPPDDLAARMWISGSSEPCPLEVDVAAGETTGACDVTPGVKRTLTIDWYVPRERPLGDPAELDLVLAQARGTLDLSEPKDKATFEVDDDDIETDTCRDMRRDTLEGKQIVTIDGVDVPPCDVDDSCALNPASAACSNVGEVCAGTDPFDPASEPP